MHFFSVFPKVRRGAGIYSYRPLAVLTSLFVSDVFNFDKATKVAKAAKKAAADNPKALKKAATKAALAGGAAGIGAQFGAGVSIAARGTAIAGTGPVAAVAATIGLLASHAFIEAADKDQKSCILQMRILNSWIGSAIPSDSTAIRPEPG